MERKRGTERTGGVREGATLRLSMGCFPALQKEERKTQQTAEQNKQNTQGQKVHIYIKRQKKSHC